MRVVCGFGRSCRANGRSTMSLLALLDVEARNAVPGMKIAATMTPASTESHAIEPIAPSFDAGFGSVSATFLIDSPISCHAMRRGYGSFATGSDTAGMRAWGLGHAARGRVPRVPCDSLELCPNYPDESVRFAGKSL